MKQKSSSRPRRAASPLQQQLSTRILDLIRTDAMAPGTRLAEVALAERLQVSRTPVRAALKLLASRRLIRRGAQRGYAVAEAPPPDKELRKPKLEQTEQLFLAIARDRRTGRLPLDVSERDLMLRYKATRPLVQRVLAKLAEVAAVQRKPGHGWRFEPSLADADARAESYRFRLVVEPAGLLEPSFQLDPTWAAEMRRQHQDMLEMPWSETSSIALFEMNADFHEGLAAASGNRFLLVSVQQQNRLRRFANYDWAFGHERVVVNCREHLAILDQIEAGDRQRAAELLRHHLQSAAALRRPPAAGPPSSRPSSDAKASSSAPSRPVGSGVSR